MKVKLINFGYTQAPMRAHANDAGADVYTRLVAVLRPHKTTKMPLGFGLELPDGYAAYVFPRTSWASKGVLCELPPIDSGYRGEIHALVTNITDEAIVIEKGTRIGQLVITPIVIADFITYDIEQRGTGAFGSTNNIKEKQV